jgi:uncharacterized membrane protein (UPF0136 family)
MLARWQMEAAKIYFIIFGLLTIAGGIMGYVKAGSVASIIAGAITGVLLIVAAFLLPNIASPGWRLRLSSRFCWLGSSRPNSFAQGESCLLA